MEPAVQPWDRRKGESERSFAAFNLYRQLPPTERNLSDAWRAYKQDPDCKLPISGAFKKWFTQGDWEARAAAWDDHLRQIEQSAAEEKAKEVGVDWIARQQTLRERAWNAASAAYEKLEKLLKMEVDEGKLTPWALQAIVISLGIADKTLRLAAGLETDRKSAEVSGPNGQPLPGAGPSVALAVIPDELLLANPQDMDDEQLSRALAAALANHTLAGLRNRLSASGHGAGAAVDEPGGEAAAAAPTPTRMALEG